MHLVVSPHDLSYAVFGLFSEEKLQLERKIDTTPEALLENLLAFIKEENIVLEDLQGMIVITGPGSFTALRAGLAVINTFAFTKEIPLVTVPNPEGKELEDLLSGVNLSETQTFATPYYGREPNITKPKN